MNSRGTLVYVPGASDRGPQVADQVAKIERQLALHSMDLDVLTADWGDVAGASLDRIDLSIPDSTSTASAVAAPLGRGAALGALVRDDPLAELRRLAGNPTTDTPDSEGVAPGRLRDADRLIAFARLATSDAGFGDAIRAAALAVGESPEYQRAQSARVPEEELAAATGRAIAAVAARQVGPVLPLADFRSAVALDVAGTIQRDLARVVLVAAVATLLAGDVGIDPGAGLKRWATDVLIPHRSEVMHDTLLGVSDVLLYQRNGDPFRRVVTDTVGRARDGAAPVITLGNSLGSIILVNALMAADAPRPDLLVTVGSQASLLQTIGALVEPGSPPPFQPWLNLYDRRDFLAFVAAPVWPDQPGIVDVAIDTGFGFPDSHGATYLAEPTVYDAIRNHPAFQTSRRKG